MSFNEIGKDFLRVSSAHGFTTGAESLMHVAEKLMLVVDEVAEAHEEVRKVNGVEDLKNVYYLPSKPNKPEGFPIEIADAVIRLIQLASALGIDLDEVVKLKNAYNETRPFRHGKNS